MVHGDGGIPRVGLWNRRNERFGGGDGKNVDRGELLFLSSADKPPPGGWNLFIRQRRSADARVNRNGGLTNV